MPDPTLTELMERDPLGLNDPEIEITIREYRDMRVKFNLGDVKAGKVKDTVPKALKGADAETFKGLMDLKIDL